jgi:hypothetical protein
MQSETDPMDVNALRISGIAVTGALIAACLTLAYSAAPRPAQAQMAAAAQENAVLFLVRFQGGGPIARAQARAVRGEVAAARGAIEAQLRRQADFFGLCFDRFTTGAAEVVLRSCAPVADAERAGFEQTWLVRLRAMRGVAYADLNAVAAPNR